MQHIMVFLTSVHWDAALGLVSIVLMLWWVTDGKSFLERRKERRLAREAAKRARIEADRKALEEWVGWDGIHSRSP